ncbi:DNA polymerase III subunit alpha [bacterium]|nr:DNA polymerase III subunit alpha [bacterium]
MNWIPLHCHTHYSLLDGLSKPDLLAKRCKDLGYTSCAITDHGTISGAISFSKACISHGIKPIIGCEFYICSGPATEHNKENSSLTHLCVIAKNLNGWKNLINLSSLANSLDYFYYKPRLNLNDFKGLCSDLIAFCGHPGTDLANCLFDDHKEVYKRTDYDEIKEMLKPNWLNEAANICAKYIEIFGKDNFFVEIQLFDSSNLVASKVIAECLRELCAKTGIKKIATPDVHYVMPEDAPDQRVLLCSAMETTLKNVNSKLENNEEFGLSVFFKSNKYYLPTIEEISSYHEEDEINNCCLIDNLCESYSLIKQPAIPNFDCPDGLSQILYLRKLCRDGWNKRFSSIKPKTEEYKIYTDRIKHELEVIDTSGLAGYFLIVQDYCNWAKSKGWIIGRGRGSGAGCMISYLLGITEVDPIKHSLIFERFYNAGRNSADRISLPDIDCDFPITKRDKVIEYIKQKYGSSNVCQMITFSRMQGRGSLKDVLRVHGFSFEESNNVTKYIPDESEISEQLQDMKDEDGDSSIIRWALENIPDRLSEYCKIEKDGTYSGRLAKEFAQAIRLEGTKRSQGKHAAGIVISNIPLSEVCPMTFDKKTKQMIAGLEMSDLESIGMVKFDILGVAVLDKIMGCINILKGKPNE